AKNHVSGRGIQVRDRFCNRNFVWQASDVYACDTSYYFSWAKSADLCAALFPCGKQDGLLRNLPLSECAAFEWTGVVVDHRQLWFLPGYRNVCSFLSDSQCCKQQQNKSANQ